VNAPEQNAELLASRGPGSVEPFFTLAIPQYGRRRFLEVNLERAFAQDCRDFEILVSDDCSPDDSNAVIPGVMESSGVPYRYFAQRRNLGYDGNVRFCLKSARGKYVFMLGNDDALASPDVLSRLREAIVSLGLPEVCVTNYRDWESGEVTRRAFGTVILGKGPPAAAHYFRSFSFTSGLVFARDAAARHDTDRWDKSVYIQIFLGCRILAAGGRLGGVDLVAVLDHIRLDGKLVPETYRVRFQDAPLSFKPLHTGLDSVARVTVDALAPFVDPRERSILIRRIYSQLLTITYPFWLFEYRRLANWGHAFGVARDLWPAHQLSEYKLRLRDRAYLWMLYFAVTVCGLTIPAGFFNRIRGRLSEWVRRRRQHLVVE
jgi:glycosyltransferase involved in cell wall biosynthesis